jgi:3-dehydro-L-gulonate 2-dehydrogenase
MQTAGQNIRISPAKMKSEFFRVLLTLGFSEPKAKKCAEILTLNSLEGVYSHGVNRFAVFVKHIQAGHVKPDATPSLVHRSGALEQWNGNLGPGPLNASFATDRAVALARKHGIGLVALANTNHWMRGGTYGWQAARKGFVFISWTNTCANMPAWGAIDPRLGNNPLVIAVPFKREAIVIDCAMSQFSYGKMELFRRAGKQLPYCGGFDNRGKLTTDPAKIFQTRRMMPIGYWKGAGLSLLLDIMAAILSGGLATHEINRKKAEYGVSQIFMAIRLSGLPRFSAIDHAIRHIVADLHKSIPANKAAKIRYPGENIVRTRQANLKNDIPVNRDVWKTILSL